jgi:hypothetical protein
MTPGAGARFDDLVAGTALRCPPPHRILSAHRPEEVVPVLTEVERATSAGHWAFGYVSYEAAPSLDPGLAVSAPQEGDPPLVHFGLCDAPAEVLPVARARPTALPARWTPDWTAQQHARAVARVREQIAAGQTYQCNLTDRLRAHVQGDLEEMYAGLALAQRGAYNAYLDLGRHVVLSASPVLFVDVFRALFPCGSVTGAPKARTMELIRDLESGSRGIYCGAIGLVAPPAAAFRARFSVAIRIIVVDRLTGAGVYGSGGGITWDSDAAAEHAELLTKAALLTASGVGCQHEPLQTLPPIPGEGRRTFTRP